MIKASLDSSESKLFFGIIICVNLGIAFLGIFICVNLGIGTHLQSMVDVCVELLYTVGKIDTSTKKVVWDPCNAQIEIRILAL